MLIRLEKIFRRTALGAFLECLFLQRSIRVAQPTAPKGNVILFAPTRRRFLLAGYGSITAYFTEFCAQLRSDGYATKYSTTNLGLAWSLMSGRPSVVILVKTSTDQVKRSLVRDWLLANAQIVFNDFENQRLMEDKKLFNSAMDEGGIHVPEIYNGGKKKWPIFSIPRFGAGNSGQVLEHNDSPTEADFTSQFVDTRIQISGQTYFTMIRLHTVGSQIAFRLPVAKDAKFDDPTVRSADTPLEIEFYEQLQARIVDPNLQSLEHIASKTAAVLGPGFYTHDLLVECHSGQIYLCGSEMHFLDWAHLNKLQPISGKVDGLEDFRDQQAAGKKSADCFLQYLTKLFPYDEKSKVPASGANSDQIAQPAR